MSAPEPGTVPITSPGASAEPATGSRAAPSPHSGHGATPPRGPRRNVDSGARRGGDGGRRGRHAVEVAPGAELQEGLVVSRQEKFGFVKCTTHEGRYFFHVNDTDGGAQYGSTVSFVVARDTTTGKDVAYHVKTLAAPAPAATSGPASRSSTPDRTAAAAAEATGGQPTGVANPAAPAAVANGAEAALAAAGGQHHRNGGANVPARRQQHLVTGFEHFGHHNHNRHPSPATQRDWRLGREATQQADAAVSPAPAAPEEAVTPLRYRGTVAQVARPGRPAHADDGLLLYIDEEGTQQAARYSAARLAEGTPRLEVGDVLEFSLAPAAPTGHQQQQRRSAVDVRFVSKSLAPSPSIEAAVAAGEAGDSLRGCQLGRVQLLKKEFGFIRQMERPGDMFFHFSQLDGWGPEDVQVGDDVEYTIRRDREGKLFAVQIRRAPPGSVVFEVVGEEELRGVVAERPSMGKQYVATSGVVEYDASPAGEDAAGDAPVAPPGPPPSKARLPFLPQDVAQGSANLRQGDHVAFRIATNLQAAKAAAQASVPGAAQYAGRRGVQVALLRYAGTVAQVNRERQFGFILYGEDQRILSKPAKLAAQATVPAEQGTAAGQDVPAAELTAEGSGASALGAASEEHATEQGAAAPAAGGILALEPASAESKAAGDGEDAAGAPAALAITADAKAGEGAGGAAGGTGAPSEPAAPKKRIFFHFKEVSGQYILKPGDEVAFVLHTNMKTGEVNAQRVKRTKEGPELPPEPEPAPKPAPVPAVNPNRTKYSGNLAFGGHRLPRIAKGPDGTRGFEVPRPNAVMPPLPALEPKPEPEPEAETEAGGSGGTEVADAQPAAVHAAGRAVADVAALSLEDAVVAAEPVGAQLVKLGSGTHLSVAAPAFVPRTLSSASLDRSAVGGSPVGSA